MKLILFSKILLGYTLPEMVAFAHDCKLDGFDLCVRPGFQVEPETILQKLPETADIMRSEGLDIPMVSGNFDLLTPDHPTAEATLKAMDKANIRLLKLGYFPFKPDVMDYLQEVHKCHDAIASWETLAARYNVKICYHTHSGFHMGMNAASLAHIMEGLNPAYFGAYADPGHFRVDGEHLKSAFAILKQWLSIVALKDVFIKSETQDGGPHPLAKNVWCRSAEGFVNWTECFNLLKNMNFQGPCTIHVEYKSETKQALLDNVKRDVAFFRQFMD